MTVAEISDPAIIVPLDPPLQAFGEPVTELRLRAPTGVDQLTIGNPVLMNVFDDDPGSTIRFDWPLMAKMIVRLSGVPLTTVGQMTPAALSAVAWKLVPFFLPAAPTPPSTTQSASG